MQVVVLSFRMWNVSCRFQSAFSNTSKFHFGAGSRHKPRRDPHQAQSFVLLWLLWASEFCCISPSPRYLKHGWYCPCYGRNDNDGDDGHDDGDGGDDDDDDDDDLVSDACVTTWLCHLFRIEIGGFTCIAGIAGTST